MYGKIISFNEYENAGVVIADDGVQYVFNGNDWTEQYAPKAGNNVDFMFDGMGSVNRISYQPNQSQTSIPPSLHKTSQDRNLLATQEFSNHDTSINNSYNGSSENLYSKESNYGMVEWTKKVLSNYATFEGRARRKEYWLFYLATIIISIAFGFIEGFMSGLMGSASMEDTAISPIILALVFFIPTIAVGTRRLHDTGRSGWWQLLWFIPIIGWIVLIVFFAQQTSPQTNQWGFPAKQIRM